MAGKNPPSTANTSLLSSNTNLKQYARYTRYLPGFRPSRQIDRLAAWDFRSMCWQISPTNNRFVRQPVFTLLSYSLFIYCTFYSHVVAWKSIAIFHYKIIKIFLSPSESGYLNISPKLFDLYALRNRPCILPNIIFMSGPFVALHIKIDVTNVIDTCRIWHYLSAP